MSSPKIIVDSLWHCLCPAFKPRAILVPASHTQRRRPLVKSSSFSTSHRQGRNEARIRLHQYHEGDHRSLDQAQGQTVSSGTESEQYGRSAEDHDAAAHAPKPLDIPNGLKGTRAPMGRARVSHGTAETSLLYDLLRESAGQGRTREVAFFVDHLVRLRLEKPNARLYSALIVVNVDPEEGSVFRVERLLEEMEQEGIILDNGICHDILKVLSIHTDYLLRNDVLSYMNLRWFNLTEDGKIDLAAALLKEGQLEQVCQQLESMRKEAIDIPGWLHDMAIYTLLEAEEVGQALHLLRERFQDGDMDISKVIWHRFLDVASSLRHREGTAFVWTKQVVPGYLNPASGICYNVLATAGRTGDTYLATEAFRILGQRSTVFTTEHYEELINTYIHARPPDVQAAMSVMTIMDSANLEPSTVTTRSICQYFVKKPQAAHDAVAILHDLHSRGRAIPVAAPNVIIEAFVDMGDFNSALLLYKSMHQLEQPQEDPDAPYRPLANIATFNLLIRGARGLGSPASYETATFLASEQSALGIPRDSMTYDRLILRCYEAGRLDRGYKYFEEMREMGFTLRGGTARAFCEALARNHDERCWIVLQAHVDAGQGRTNLRFNLEAAWMSAAEAPSSETTMADGVVT